MNLFPHLRPGTTDYTPPLLNPNPITEPATLKAMQNAGDHARTAMRMIDAVAYAAVYAGTYADYHAPHCGSPVDADGRYDLNAFMTDAYALTRRLASRALGPAAQVRLVVPMWVHTVQQAITEDVITVPNYEPGGDVWRAIAIAAADRPPSLLLTSWDWCATFSCDTPDAGTETGPAQTHVCSGTCDDSEAAA